MIINSIAQNRCNMSLRIEQKISYKNLSIFNFKRWLFSNNAKILHPARIINSVYFDNNFKMYDDSVEGTAPRKKIRVRTYETKNFFLSNSNFKEEKKISNYNYRSKIISKYNFDKEKFFSGIHDFDYGLCKPILNVVYKRNYFKIFDIRLTLDENICYHKVLNRRISNFFKRESECVIELKSDNIDNTDFLNKMFYFPRTRFSKYCRGIEALFNK